MKSSIYQSAVFWFGLFFLWIVTRSFSYSFSCCTMQPQSVWFYGMVKQFLFCFSDTSTTLAPPTVLPKWSHLKGVTKSSSALSAELKKERRYDIFYLIAICTHNASCTNFLAIPVSQLCFDYQFDSVEGQHKISCHCGAPECRKWIN